MISVANALQTVLNTTQDYGVEEIPFLKSIGRILKEPVFADSHFPPFNRVAMDGIAIDFYQFKSGQRAVYRCWPATGGAVATSWF